MAVWTSIGHLWLGYLWALRGGAPCGLSLALIGGCVAVAECLSGPWRIIVVGRARGGMGERNSSHRVLDDTIGHEAATA